MKYNQSFIQTDNQRAVLFTVSSLLELFLSCCIVVTVAKENLIEIPAIVLLANFQRVQMLQQLRLALDWLSVSLFIDQSECLVFILLCAELTLSCTELPECCLYLNQSELSNFFMYIIIGVIVFNNLMKNAITLHAVGSPSEFDQTAIVKRTALAVAFPRNALWRLECEL